MKFFHPFILLFPLLISLFSCSPEEQEQGQRRTYRVGLLVDFPKIPAPIREQAKDKTAEILSDRLKRVDAFYVIDTTRDGFDLLITTTLTEEQLDFLLSTKGEVEMWESIPGKRVAEQLHEAEDRLSFFMYPDQYDIISGIEYIPDSSFYEEDSSYLSVTDTVDIASGMDKIQERSFLYMAYPFTSRIRFGNPGKKAKVGKARASDIRDVTILFDKAFEYGLIHRDVAFYWGMRLKDTKYYELFAVDTSTQSNLGLKRSLLSGVEYSESGALTFKLNERGEVEMLGFSESHLDRPMALLVDESVIATPIMSRMISKGRFSVDVDLSSDSTRLLAHILDLPKLPSNVTVLSISRGQKR